jgi:S1-C subfamily serine protease
LTSLTLKGTPFSSPALRDLRKQRPTLAVVCRSSAMLGINSGLEGPCILTSVFHKSGAEDAGLKAGDEVVEVNGQRVRDFSDLTIAVYPHGPGDKLAVKYRRAGKVETVDVTLKPRFER